MFLSCRAPPRCAGLPFHIPRYACQSGLVFLSSKTRPVDDFVRQRWRTDKAEFRDSCLFCPNRVVFWVLQAFYTTTSASSSIIITTPPSRNAAENMCFSSFGCVVYGLWKGSKNFAQIGSTAHRGNFQLPCARFRPLPAWPPFAAAGPPSSAAGPQAAGTSSRREASSACRQSVVGASAAGVVDCGTVPRDSLGSNMGHLIVERRDFSSCAVPAANRVPIVAAVHMYQ